MTIALPIIAIAAGLYGEWRIYAGRNPEPDTPAQARARIGWNVIGHQMAVTTNKGRRFGQ
jgi:hypothetical protein